MRVELVEVAGPRSLERVSAGGVITALAGLARRKMRGQGEGGNKRKSNHVLGKLPCW